jgi:hypothetical protein
VTSISFPASAIVNLATLRVVLVEDESANVRLLRRLLYRIGVREDHVVELNDGACVACATVCPAGVCPVFVCPWVCACWDLPPVFGRVCP